jgi:serine protease Do
MALPAPGRIAEALRRSTVQIRTGRGPRQGGGSGAVIGPDQILTNAHVIQGRTVEIASWEGKLIPASIVKMDSARDLALLEAPRLAGVPLTLGDSDLLQPGTPVVAAGNPLGFVGAISTGTVHRIGAIPLAAGYFRASDWICADIRLAPGNSGGPLADFAGCLVGLNTMVAAGGLAFAISSRMLQRFLSRLKTGAYLGVTVRPVQLREQRPALLLLELAPNGAAAQASLLPGDLLVEGNGKPLEEPEDLLTAIDEAHNNLLDLTFYRGRQDQLRRVTARLKHLPQTDAA